MNGFKSTLNLKPSVQVSSLNLNPRGFKKLHYNLVITLCGMCFELILNVFCSIREKSRLRVFEINVLNGLFRPKAGKLTEHRRKLRNVEFQYS